eukprot:3292720-Amphidinium_carterae.1
MGHSPGPPKQLPYLIAIQTVMADIRGRHRFAELIFDGDICNSNAKNKDKKSKNNIQQQRQTPEQEPLFLARALPQQAANPRAEAGPTGQYVRANAGSARTWGADTDEENRGSGQT